MAPEIAGLHATSAPPVFTDRSFYTRRLVAPPKCATRYYRRARRDVPAPPLCTRQVRRRDPDDFQGHGRGRGETSFTCLHDEERDLYLGTSKDGRLRAVMGATMSARPSSRRSGGPSTAESVPSITPAWRRSLRRCAMARRDNTDPIPLTVMSFGTGYRCQPNALAGARPARDRCLFRACSGS